MNSDVFSFSVKPCEAEEGDGSSLTSADPEVQGANERGKERRE